MNNLFYKIEVRVAVIAACLAFLMSPVVGIISGIPVPLILVRTLILALLFGGVGYGAFAILKQFVPEIYDLFNVDQSDTRQNPEEIVTDLNDSEDEEGIDSLGEMPDDEQESESVPDESFDPGLETSTLGAAPEGKKMGRHIIEEQSMKYEPKIVAEAIRTMMSRDED